MNYWNKINGAQYFTQVNSNFWRIIEDQSRSTTRKFVNSSEEHDILEKLLDQNKPKIKFYGDEEHFKSLHYLLFTPFRYPPLKWGSRFGTQFERSLFYASRDLSTAMSEVAFYKLAFFKASEGNLGGKTISYTAFKMLIISNYYIDLCLNPFSDFEEQISSKTDYKFSHELGSDMRNEKVECFQYKSARDSQGVNIGVFSPKALLNNKKIENTFEYLNCYSTKEVVEFSFKNREKDLKYIFSDKVFQINGQIPQPTY